MPNGDPKKIKTQVMEVNSKLQALLDLFGSKKHVEEDLEVLYGITSRAELALATSQLEMMNALLTQVTITTKALYENAKLVAKAPAVRS
jgi:hypothetical protein